MVGSARKSLTTYRTFTNSCRAHVVGNPLFLMTVFNPRATALLQVLRLDWFWLRQHVKMLRSDVMIGYLYTVYAFGASSLAHV